MSQTPEFYPGLEIVEISDEIGDQHVHARIGRVAFPEIVVVAPLDEELQLVDDIDTIQPHYLPDSLD